MQPEELTAIFNILSSLERTVAEASVGQDDAPGIELLQRGGDVAEERSATHTTRSCSCA